MKESYPFGVATQEHGGIPLSTAQDGAISSEKRKIQMFADDLRRMLKGDTTKHRWQLVDAAGKPTDLKSAIAALDAKPKPPRLANTQLPKNKAAQKRNNPVTPFERQIQSQQDKAALVQRLYGGGGSLEKKFWPNA